MAREPAYLGAMATFSFMTSADFPTSRNETAKTKEQRIELEAEMIAKARASIAVGCLVSLEAVPAWVDSWDADNELPLPRSGP